MDEVLIALHQAVRRRKGGISGLARELGRQEKTLMAKLSPADDAHQPTVGELVAILHRLEAAEVEAVLSMLVTLFGYGLTARAADRSDSVMRAVLQSVTEHGDVVREVERSMSDGVLSDVERTRILRECIEARRALAVLENTLLGGGS